MSTELPLRTDPSTPPGPPVARRGVFLALMCSVQFVLVVGGTVVTVSLPAIRQELHLAPAQLQWVLTGFALTFGCLLLLGGRAADVFGRRRLFLIGLLVFAGGSLLCAVASGPGLLIAARAVAGAGAAMASPAAMSLLTGVFVSPRERSFALGMWAAIGAIGATLGNVMGGILTSAGGWRWIFLINVPVCVLAVVTALVVVPAVRVRSAQRINLLSGLLITAGLASLIIGLGELQSRGAALLPVLTLVASVVLVGLFVLRQARGDDPLLPLGLFRSRTAFAFVFVVVTAGAGIGAYFTSSLFMQETLGWSALQAGLAFVPWAALGAVVAQVVSRNLERVGPRVLVPAALGVTALGAGVLALGLSPSTTYTGGMLLPFLLLGLGTGAAGVSCTVTAMSGIPRHRHGVGAGVLNSTQAIGSALAIAVVVLLSSTWTERALARGGPAAESQLAGQRFALLVMAGFALAGAVLAAVVLPWRVPVPVDKDEDVALSRPASAPLA